jgi:hypothetical protein
VTNALAEQDRLAELERVVERGLGAFREVGLALLEIRERGGDVAVVSWCQTRDVPWSIAELAMELALCR